MSGERIVTGPGFSIRYSNEPGYLRAHVFDGTDSQAVSVAMWRMLGEECRALAVTRLLVVEELEGEVSADAIAPVNQAMLDVGLIAVRIAFVELLDGVENNEYGEILCRELGMTVRVHTREDAARHWLLYGD